MARLLGQLFGVLLITSLTGLGASLANAQELGVLEPGSELVLPLDITALAGDIAVEIDTIDVTGFISIIDGSLVLAGTIPLSAGVHQVIVYLTQGADYEVIARYSFVTEQDTDAAGISVTIDATHEAGVRQLNGAATGFATSSGEVNVANDDNTFSGRIGYLGTTFPADQINGNSLDITEYYFEVTGSGRVFDVTGRLGHQVLGYDPALVGDISRRGASLMFQRPDQRLSFGIFGIRAMDALGVDNFFGLEDETDRLFGAQLAGRPFGESDFRLSVQGYQGQGVPNGGLIVGAGDGVSIALDGTMLQGRLRYGSAFGRTNWDEDGDGLVFAEETGDAWLYYVEFDALAGNDNGRSLTLGLAYEVVDYGYFSLANPGLAVGAETYRITADYAADRFGGEISVDTQRTNVGGLAIWPTDRISLISADGWYELQGQGVGQNTSLRFGGSLNRKDRLITPPAAPLPEDFTSLQLYLGMSKYNDDASWSLDYTFIDYDDQSALDLDDVSHSLAAAFDYRFSDRLSVNGNGSVTYVMATGGEWWRSEASVGVFYDVVPNELSLAVNAGLTNTDEPGALSGRYVSADSTWSFAPAAQLVLSGSYSDGSYAVQSGDTYDAIVSLFLRVQTSSF